MLNLNPQFIVPTSCGKLPMDIGMPSGGSLTADQWLLLATVYGPIVVRLFLFPLVLSSYHTSQIPQLWTASLLSHGGGEVLTRRISSIAEIELEKDREVSQKAEDRKAIEAAKAQGKEALAAVKARITAATQARKLEKARVAAERQAEKARLAAQNRAKQAERKVRNHVSQSDNY
jgi:hypothetical protein